MVKKFTWVHKDYNNESLNNLAKRVTEYQTARLFVDYYTDVQYDYQPPTDGSEFKYIGESRGFCVTDLHLVNDVLNYNMYFKKNGDDGNLTVTPELYGTFDCLVSLSAGTQLDKKPSKIGLKGNNFYIIDISPTALHETFNAYKNIQSIYKHVDIFSLDSLKDFLKNCNGTRGFFMVSNVFLYIVSSLIYDVHLRLEMQNKFVEILANDKIEWYLDIYTADGIFYPCISAKELQNKKLDPRFKILPWI